MAIMFDQVAVSRYLRREAATGFGDGDHIFQVSRLRLRAHEDSIPNAPRRAGFVQLVAP
jgi:hypothetical protein